MPLGLSAYDCPKETRVKALIIYDSMYGNTEKITQAMRDALPGATVMRPAEARTAQLSGVDLLIVGSPTLGGRPSEATKAFLDAMPASCLTGVKVAAFDTRLTKKWVKLFGWASDKILARLLACGGTEASAAQGFFVEGTKGPLAEKETEKAAAWAKTLDGAR